MQLKQYFSGISEKNLPEKIDKLEKLGNSIIPELINLSETKKEEIIEIIDLLIKKIRKKPNDYDKHIINTIFQVKNISLKILCLVSGGGTTMNSLVDELKKGEINLIEVVGVIASQTEIGAIDKAILQKLHTVVLNKFHAKDPDTLNSLVELFKADIIIGNGWLPLIPKEVIEKFQGIILNQHPGPLRKNHLDFGGKGMYGTRVTASRIIYLLETGATGDELFTESTVHIMTEKFDEGYSVGVKKLNIEKEIEKYREKIEKLDKKEDTLENKRYKKALLRSLISDIQTKLLVLEHENVAETIKTIGETKITEKHSSYDEILVPQENAGILEKSKQKAIQLYPNG